MSTSTKTIFDFTDYKAFLKHVEITSSHLQKGFRSRLAENIGCQSAFISQVLNGRANFSLEQGLKLIPFLKMDSTEQQYFLWMIECGRAGTNELRSYFLNLMEELREKYLRIKNRVNPELSLSTENQNIYYSQWFYSAIHILTTIPEYCSIESISKALRLNQDLARDAVMFLVKIGLLTERKGKLSPGSTQVHLDRTSINISKHHTNWRIKAIESLGGQQKTDTHYSTVSSLSHSDVEALRGKIATLIEEYARTVRPSKEETLYCFNIDFFKLLS